MGAKKKVKKKRIEPKVAKRADVIQEDLTGVVEHLKEQLNEAVECLKHYTKKEQIGDLANPAIELLTKWGIIV